MIGWHGTHGDFDAFDESWFGSCPERSPNGRLGVWMFLDRENAVNIGPRVLEIELDVPQERILRLTNQRMYQDHARATRTEDPHGYFDALRAAMRADGYQVIVVSEKNGAEGMAVVLDLDCIARVTDLSAAPGPR